MGKTGYHSGRQQPDVSYPLFSSPFSSLSQTSPLHPFPFLSPFPLPPLPSQTSLKYLPPLPPPPISTPNLPRNNKIFLTHASNSCFILVYSSLVSASSPLEHRDKIESYMSWLSDPGSASDMACRSGGDGGDGVCVCVFCGL